MVSLCGFNYHQVRSNAAGFVCLHRLKRKLTLTLMLMVDADSKASRTQLFSVGTATERIARTDVWSGVSSN
jgi:hypothetical protein